MNFEDKEHHQAASAKGNQTRQLRFELKNAVKDGRKSLAEVAINPPDFIMKLTVEEFLIMQPGWGVTNINKVCNDLDLSPAKYMEDVTRRQRHYMSLWLRRSNHERESTKLTKEINQQRDMFVSHRKRGINED